MRNFSSFVLLAMLVSASFAKAETDQTLVFKYFLRANDLISERCLDDGEDIASKINLSFTEPVGQETQMRLRVKACTFKLGLKKFNFNFTIPVQLLDENFLLALPVNKTQKVGARVYVTREPNVNNRAIFSISPEAFGKQAEGVTGIRFSVLLDTAERENLLAVTNLNFMWSHLHITYKKGFLMPTVVLRGELKVVESE